MSGRSPRPVDLDVPQRLGIAQVLRHDLVERDQTVDCLEEAEVASVHCCLSPEVYRRSCVNVERSRVANDMDRHTHTLSYDLTTVKRV